MAAINWISCSAWLWEGCSPWLFVAVASLMKPVCGGPPIWALLPLTKSARTAVSSWLFREFDKIRWDPNALPELAPPAGAGATAVANVVAAVVNKYLAVCDPSSASCFLLSDMRSFSKNPLSPVSCNSVDICCCCCCRCCCCCCCCCRCCSWVDLLPVMNEWINHT